jgi:hypothetical protein
MVYDSKLLNHYRRGSMGQIIKRTKYCDLLAQGKEIDGESVSAVERIWVNEYKREEIRFAWYKIKDGKEVFQARPLDLQEEDLLALMKSGIENEVFSKDFLENLKTLL